MNIQALAVNPLGIVLAMIFNMVVGMLWFGPLFGKTWMKLMNLKKEDAEMGKFTIVFALLAAAATAWGLGVFQILTGMTTLAGSFILAVLVLLFFICTTGLNSVLWEGKSTPLYCFNMTHFAVSLIGMSVIVGLFQ